MVLPCLWKRACLIGLNQIFFAPLEREWSVFGRFPGYNPLMACWGFETQHCYYAPGDLGNQWFMFCLLTTNQFNGWKALLFWMYLLLLERQEYIIFIPQNIKTCLTPKDLSNWSYAHVNLSFCDLQMVRIKTKRKPPMIATKFVIYSIIPTPVYLSHSQNFRHL